MTQNQKIKVAIKAMHRASTYDIGFIANNIITTALTEIECIRKEGEK